MKIMYNAWQQTEIEVPVPSYWKKENSYCRVAEQRGVVIVDFIAHYPTSNTINFITGAKVTPSFGLFDFSAATKISEFEFFAAIGFVMEALCNIRNDIDKSGGFDSFWGLNWQLMPLNPPE